MFRSLIARVQLSGFRPRIMPCKSCTKVQASHAPCIITDFATLTGVTLSLALANRCDYGVHVPRYMYGAFDDNRKFRNHA